MKQETFFAPSQTRATAQEWLPFAIAGVAALAILLIYWPTASSVYAIWTRSGTFTHGFIVIPISLWLAWRDRDALQRIPARPYLPAVAATAAVGFGWLAAQLSTVPSASQFALLFMVQLSIIAILGLALSRRLAFPLAFLFFAVPFGEFLLPVLMDRTADAAVALLKLTGVPVYREGDHLQIPSGSWAVVEACSGLRYLVASLMAGTLFAYLRYRSLKRRLLFIAASIAVPIIANWLRAYGIILLGHLTNNKLGVDVDHLIYGWIFFGVVMLLLFWVGSFWEEPDGSGAAVPRLVLPPNASTPKTAFAATAALCILVAAVWPILLVHFESDTPSVAPVLQPLEAKSGWKAETTPLTLWKPSYSHPQAEWSEQFSKDGRSVGVYIAFYRNQHGDSRLVSTQNSLVLSSDADWKLLSRGAGVQTLLAKPTPVRTALVGGREQRLAVREWYWVEGRYTGSLPFAAALVLAAKLAGRGDNSAAIVVYTPIDERQTSSEDVLDAFASDMGSSLTHALEAASLQR